MNLCKCGCGQEVKQGNIFINGHNWKGMKHSEKSIIKMSNKKIGIPRSKETILKMSKSKMGKQINKKNPNWKDGKWRYVRKQVLIRDNYTCQHCNLKEPDIMVVDHILPKSIYPELRLDLNNLVTLCPNCHARKTNKDYKNKMFSKGVI